MADIFDRRCALVNQQGICHQCSEINGFINPKQEVQQLKVAKAVDKRAQKAHLLTLRTALVKSINPLEAPGAELHTYLLRLIDQAAKTHLIFHPFSSSLIV